MAALAWTPTHMIAAHPPPRLLFVTADVRHGARLCDSVQASGLATLEHVDRLPDGSTLVATGAIDAVVLEIGRAGGIHMDAIEALRAELRDRIPIVVIASASEEALAHEAVEHGAQDYLLRERVDVDVMLRCVRYAQERLEWRRESRRQEAELLQSQKMEAIGRLAGGVAHDFNNVLAAIFGYSDLLLEQFTEDDPRRADLQEIRRSAERAAALTRQLLAFSRKQIMQPRRLNLNEVIVNLRALLTRLVGEDITLEFHAQDEPWSVHADPGQMEQVLMNLAANARDAMPEGGRLTIETANAVVHADTSRPGLESGNFVTLTVADSGTGVPEDVRAHMFEPFFTTKEQGKGTGLGLATVYGIVKQSGGSVYVESEEGAGTRFVICLPRVP